MLPKHTKANFLKTLIIIFFSTTIMSHAQDNTQNNSPSIKFNLFSVDNLVISDIINIDEKFSKKHKIPILTPFTFKVPRQDGVKPLVEYGTESGGMIIKINFATGGEEAEMKDRQLIENLQFIPMSIELIDHEKRIKTLIQLISVDAFNQATAKYEKKEYIGARRTKIGDIDVVDAVGKYIDPDLGLVYVRVLGFLHPTNENSIFAVANIVADKYEISNLDQLFLTGSGKTIESFEYLSD